MNLNDIQMELEAEMVSLGMHRYREEIKRGLSTVGPGKALMRKALRPTAEAIEAYRADPKGRRKGMRYIKDVDEYVLADLTMRRVLDCAIKQETLTKTSKAIAAAVEWHVKDASLREASVSIWNKTQERLKKTQDPNFRRKSIDGTVAGVKRWAEENAPDLAEMLQEVKGPEWDIEERIEVGTALIDLFAKATGLIETFEIRKSRKQSKVVVRLTEGTEEWLRKQNEYHSVLRPVHLPMVVPPQDWCAMDEGGYLDNSKAGVAFIKTKARRLEVDTADMQDAFDAVNLIQRTAWRVNFAVYDVMSRVWQAGSRIGNVPPRYPEDGERALQPLPMKYADMTPEQRSACKDKELSVWRQHRKEAHEYNTELRSDCKNFGSLMDVATRFSTFPEFFHPHKLDWRQRAYPISIFLSPQGDQFNRGLIEFAEGKRMGDSENAAAWLAIHGANCYGVDKVSFEERIAWVEEHEAQILESALFPFDCTFWQDADGGAKAWPFLAFCFEWLGYRLAGDDFVTHLPVALDGSNSGLQHLSAMLRDPEGAQVTCVSPGEQPEDVYQMIADAVEAKLATIDDPWASLWAGSVTRKVVKQPTMTYTYSATESGMRNQIASALRELDKKAQNEGRPSYLEFTDPRQTNSDAASFLAPIVREAIRSQMTKAAEAMDFLQGLARCYSQTGLPLRWTTPLGVPVVQYYPTSTSKRKKVFINGQRHDLRIQVDAADRLDKKRAASGVSPNYVHSMDSTHLLWTVLYCNDVHRLDSFSMIHDSFGTHATACDELASATREMFIALYEMDRLSELRGEIAALLETTDEDLIQDLPLTPAFGMFDLRTVRESDYFFA